MTQSWNCARLRSTNKRIRYVVMESQIFHRKVTFRVELEDWKRYGSFNEKNPWFPKYQQKFLILSCHVAYINIYLCVFFFAVNMQEDTQISTRQCWDNVVPQTELSPSTPVMVRRQKNCQTPCQARSNLGVNFIQHTLTHTDTVFCILFTTLYIHISIILIYSCKVLIYIKYKLTCFSLWRNVQLGS